MDNNIQNTEEQELAEILKVRRDKLFELRASGLDPFANTKYDVTAKSSDIRGSFDEYEGKTVSIAGRIMSRRIMGKASFCDIYDGNGRIQSYVRRDDVGEEDYASFKK